MVVEKQVLFRCPCGQALDFPQGEIKAICKCGMIWEIGLEGFWSITGRFATIFAKQRKKHYQKLMEHRKRKRKAGKR